MTKKNHYYLTIAAILGIVAFVSGCVRGGSGDLYHNYAIEFTPDMPDLQNRVQAAFINAYPGAHFVFKGGTFHFSNTLSLDAVDGVSIDGSGMGETIFSFDGQTGAEGIKITNSTDVVLANFTIKDTKGDAIKVKDVNGITFYQVGVDWTGEPDADNGAYGLYPVTSQNVLIDKCYVRAASDAGIYVGQSSNCIVRNSLVEQNVAGIEIENTSNTDVHGNTARNNTGGILVFDLPGLPIKNGTKNRVYGNIVTDNSYKNFANPAGMVANVPPGTGILLMSAQEVEIYSNQLSMNNMMGIGIMSFTTLAELAGITYNDPSYDPYSHGIYIHDNQIERSNNLPPYSHPISSIITAYFPGGNIPDILYDGFVYPNSGDADRICLKSNGNAAFGNLDVENGFANISTDATPHNCTQTAIAAPTVNAPNYRP